MAANHTIRKVCALLLILIFSQKMGMSLYLHNWLHVAKQQARATKTDHGRELKYACGCINDFTNPLAETEVLQLPVPVATVISPAPVAGVTIPVIYKHFHSLRAPPVPVV